MYRSHSFDLTQLSLLAQRWLWVASTSFLIIPSNVPPVLTTGTAQNSKPA
jgi:hypothetical protein